MPRARGSKGSASSLPPWGCREEKLAWFLVGFLTPAARASLSPGLLLSHPFHHMPENFLLPRLHPDSSLAELPSFSKGTASRKEILGRVTARERLGPTQSLCFYIRWHRSAPQFVYPHWKLPFGNELFDSISKPASLRFSRLGSAPGIWASGEGEPGSTGRLAPGVVSWKLAVRPGWGHLVLSVVSGQGDPMKMT